MLVFFQGCGACWLMHESGDVVLRAKKQVADSLEYVERLKRELSEKNLSAEECERAPQPALSFHAITGGTGTARTH